MHTWIQGVLCIGLGHRVVLINKSGKAIHHAHSWALTLGGLKVLLRLCIKDDWIIWIHIVLHQSDDRNGWSLSRPNSAILGEFSLELITACLRWALLVLIDFRISLLGAIDDLAWADIGLLTTGVGSILILWIVGIQLDPYSSRRWPRDARRLFDTARWLRVDWCGTRVNIIRAQAVVCLLLRRGPWHLLTWTADQFRDVDIWIVRVDLNLSLHNFITCRAHLWLILLTL